MITLLSGGYTKDDFAHLKKLLEQDERTRNEIYCKNYADCRDCPVRKSCADLARLGIHLEGTQSVCG